MIDVQPPFYSDGTNVHLCPTGSLTMIPGRDQRGELHVLPRRQSDG